MKRLEKKKLKKWGNKAILIFFVLRGETLFLLVNCELINIIV